MKVLLEILLGLNVKGFYFFFFLGIEFLQLESIVIYGESLELDGEWSELFELFDDVLFIFNVFGELWVFLEGVRGCEGRIILVLLQIHSFVQ